MLRLALSALALVFTYCLPAQLGLTPALPNVVGADDQLLPLAWLGGLNAPQYNAADLDGDGLGDLVIFDRAGDALLALRGDGSGNYLPAPELLTGFPNDLTHWILLRDYDADGVQDLFAYSAEYDGFRAYRGQRAADGLLTYPATPTYRGLRYPLGGGSTPIFVTDVDYPAVDDVDGDGDLDILTFSVGGGYLEYYQNQSVERGFGTDTLIYMLASDCYGGFFESGQSPELTLSATPGECARNVRGSDPIERRHAGSTTLSIDIDGDGLQDIMLGDISSAHIVLARNGGSRTQAHFTSQDPTWPSGGVPVEVDYFPAIFHLDIDQDGVRDLLAAPTQTVNAENVDVGWYYRNVGTEARPDFVFQDSQQFVRQSIDYGSGTAPAAFDYDADGRPDLVVGNNEEYIDGLTLGSQLRLLRNTTAPGGPPSFAVVDNDYLGLRQFINSTSAFAPAFGDLDGDGDTDAVIGERGGQLIYLENTAGPGRPAAFATPVFGYMDLDAGQLSKPALADLDRDGLTDLLVGGFDGRIRFYRNLGTTGAPRFDPSFTTPGNVEQLGGINTNTPGGSSGHPAPAVVTYADRFVLLTGNRSGILEAYSFTDYTQAFTPLSRSVDSLDLGGFSTPATADFDGDGLLDLVLGNQRGGLSYYTTELGAELSTGLFSPSLPAVEFTLAPNPTTGQVRLRNLPGSRVQTVKVYSSVGQLVLQEDAGSRSSLDLDLGTLVAGVYVVRVEAGDGVGVRRVVVSY
ncbi:T9SS type A sorting domain-containing protein [Neolewinella sp.]|uniref:T9SS type A sorting domain-containing protein n=1 Tax=Neolewinella sp. TaxID=2993543 RepID=UPI003B5262A9